MICDKAPDKILHTGIEYFDEINHTIRQAVILATSTQTRRLFVRIAI